MGRRQSEWRELYERHYGFAVRLAFRYLGDYDKAVAAVSTGWRRILTGNGGDKAEPFRRCLQRILIEVVVELAQEGAVKDLGSTKALPAQGVEIWAMPPGRSERRKAERSRDLILLLVGLPCVLRFIYNLRVIDGYSPAETSSLLGIGTADVESKLSCARSMLQT